MKKLSKQNQYLVLCLILIIATVYIYLSNKYLIYRYGLIKNIHGKCFIGCDNSAGLCNLSIRGEKYCKMVDGVSIMENEDCFMSFWGAAHFMMWGVVGFFCPDLFWESAAIGIGWEYWECAFLDNHDTLDVLFNITGFLTGRIVANYV